MHDGVDFYYANGFLVNFYSHGLATGNRAYPGMAGVLIPDYIQYAMNAQRFPRPWSSNARALYAWWQSRYPAKIGVSYGTNGSHSVATVTIAGAQDTNTTVEILASGFGSAVVSQVLTNGVAAGTNSYRISGELIKVRVGTTVTNVQLEYFPGPLARDDFYIVSQSQSLTATTGAGVLSNDWSGTWSGSAAITNSPPQHGTLSWNSDLLGGFTYTPATNGTECFTYRATDGTYDFGSATVSVFVTKTGSLFSDDFTRCSARGLVPWQLNSGGWSISGGTMQGTQAGDYANAYLGPLWTNSNYSVEAQVQFASGSCGGGLGARLNTANGAHYAAWLYPDGSPCGGNRLALVKFSTWKDWGYNGSVSVPMAQTNVSASTGWHPLRLVCSNAVLQVFYHGTNVLAMTDADTALPVYSTGGVSCDLYGGTVSATHLIVNPVP